MSIYVLRSDNLVKIGFSDGLRKRVRSIIAAVPVPVEFVGHMPGDRAVEKHFHTRFAAYRFSGEWFKETEEMRAIFSALLIPNMPKAETPRAERRSSNRDAQFALSDRVKSEAVLRWPGKSKADIVLSLAAVFGWPISRVRDFYYKEPRIVLRGVEFQDVSAWLEERETA
jgi:hypothetical protein